jgi:hypothetical protein
LWVIESHIHGVLRSASIAVDQFGSAPVPFLDELEPVDDGCVVREGTVKLEHPHDMVGHVTDLDIL